MAKIALLMPDKTFRRQFSSAHLQSLTALARNEQPIKIESIDGLKSHPDSNEIRIILTGWGTPLLTTDILQICPKLELVVHCAGSLKTVFDPALYQHGVRSTNSATANAIPVAEFLLSWVLRWNKQLPYWESRYRKPCVFGERSSARLDSVGNRNKSVGIISASKVGLYFAKLLRHFDLDILIYDPFLDQSQISIFGAEKVDLPTLLRRSDIVSINAPLLPETRHMIAADELALMRDDSLLINTARGALLDHDALLTELQSGRLTAVLDVTDPEPLPADSPFFDLANAYITPHVAGSLGLEIHRMTESALDEVTLYLNGGQLQHEVSADNWQTVA